MKRPSFFVSNAQGNAVCAPAASPASSPAVPPLPPHRTTKARSCDSPLPTRAASYLIRRRGVLFFRCRVPNDIRPVLGVTELRRSLSTAMLREARPVVMRLAVVVQDVYALARAWNDHTNGHEISDNIMNTHDIQNLTPVHIRELADQWLHEALTNANTFFLRIAGERQGIQDADALAQRQESLSKIAKATRERIALNQVEYLSDRAVQLMVQAGGMNVTDAEALRKTDAFRLLCQELAKASVKYYDVMGKTSGGEFEVFDQTLEALEAKKTAKAEAEARAAQAALLADSGTTSRQGRSGGVSGKNKEFPLLSVAVEQYIKAKIQTGEWKEASKKDIPPCLHQFREIMTELEKGREPRVDQLTRQHMRDFTALLTRLPYRTVGNKAYAGLSWHDIADKGKAEPRKLSVDTIKNRQVRIRSLLNWIEQEYEDDNGNHVQVKYLNRELTPPKALRIKAAKEDSSREGFTCNDLEALFKNSESYRRSTAKYPSRFWSPLIGLFTGMRLEEICQLCLSDIQTVDGVRCFSINDEGDIKHVKTFAGKRLVPVHPFLWDTLNLKGLFEERMGIASAAVTAADPHATLLFTDMHERATRLRAGKQDFRQLCAPVSKWFTLFRRARGIGAEEGEKSNQVFHSFRHTLVTYLHKEARIDLSMIKAVVGHVEGQEMGITAQYAGEWPVVTLRDEVILKLNWHERFPFLARLAW